MRLTGERVRGRLVEVEIGEAAGLGWVAVGVVREGLPHEEGTRFEARGAGPEEAQTRLRARDRGLLRVSACLRRVRV